MESLLSGEFETFLKRADNSLSDPDKAEMAARLRTCSGLSPAGTDVWAPHSDPALPLTGWVFADLYHLWDAVCIWIRQALASMSAERPTTCGYSLLGLSDHPQLLGKGPHV